MSINYKDFETPKLTFVKGDGVTKTFPSVVPPRNGNCEGSFDEVESSDLVAMGKACSKAFFLGE